MWLRTHSLNFVPLFLASMVSRDTHGRFADFASRLCARGTLASCQVDPSSSLRMPSFNFFDFDHRRVIACHFSSTVEMMRSMIMPRSSSRMASLSDVMPCVSGVSSV